MLRPNEVSIHDTCPYCGRTHDMAMGITGRERPCDGDVSFCAHCGWFAIFDKASEGGLRKTTKSEWLDLQLAIDVSRIQATWLLAKVIADSKEAPDEDR